MSTSIILSLVGILLAITFIIVTAYHGFQPRLMALVAVLILCVFNGFGIQDGLNNLFSSGFGNSMKNLFLMFVACMIFGYIMNKAGCAHAIAYAIADRLPVEWAPSVVMLVAAVLALGGLSTGGYLVILPIGIIMFSKANYSKDMLLGSVMAGMWTFTNMMPLSPSMQNGIVQNLLGVPTSAGLIPGMASALFLFVFNFFYVTWQARRWRSKGRVFDSWDEVPEDTAEFRESLPSVWLSLVPIVVVLIVYNVFGLVLATSLFVGSFVCTLLFWKKFTLKEWVKVWEEGCFSALGPVSNTATMGGVGAIISQTVFFKWMIDAVASSNINPYLLCFLGTNLIAFMCGSATSGVNVFIPAAAPLLESYVAQGFSMNNMARCMVNGCIGMDSLPNNGSLIASCDIFGTTVRKSYFPVFIACTVAPIVSGLIVIPLSMIF